MDLKQAIEIPVIKKVVDEGGYKTVSGKVRPTETVTKVVQPTSPADIAADGISKSREVKAAAQQEINALLNSVKPGDIAFKLDEHMKSIFFDPFEDVTSNGFQVTSKSSKKTIDLTTKTYLESSNPKTSFIRSLYRITEEAGVIEYILEKGVQQVFSADTFLDSKDLLSKNPDLSNEELEKLVEDKRAARLYAYRLKYVAEDMLKTVAIMGKVKSPNIEDLIIATADYIYSNSRNKSKMENIDYLKVLLNVRNVQVSRPFVKTIKSSEEINSQPWNNLTQQMVKIAWLDLTSKASILADKALDDMKEFGGLLFTDKVFNEIEVSAAQALLFAIKEVEYLIAGAEERSKMQKDLYASEIKLIEDKLKNDNIFKLIANAKDQIESSPDLPLEQHISNLKQVIN